MAHAIWHIEPSYYKDWWKDRVRGLGEAIQSGALSAQQNVIDPTLDRVMGTAPGIPARPFFGGETGVPPRQPTRPSIPIRPRSVADIVRNVTPASLGLTMPPSAAVTGPRTVPIAAAPATTDTTALQDMLRKQLININAGRPAKASDAIVEAETVTPPQPRRTAREEAMHGRLTEPSIMERPGVKEFLGREEDDELSGMLKMMFISDLMKGSAADTPSYPRAVSVGPASRDFAPLPSWRWR
jgi:hypothetical protein